MPIRGGRRREPISLNTTSHSSDPATMGVSYDHASSMLLCAEDNSSILDFDADYADEDELGVNGASQGLGIVAICHQRTLFFRDSCMILPIQTEECLSALLEKESDHVPARDYAKRLMSGELDISVRKDAVDWIQKVHAYYSFGALSAYLSVNYLDRFLSFYELPKGKSWMTQLLAVACLSLAAKMEETEVPLSLDLQIGNAKHVFEAKTIQRMELLVLSTLKWRMQSVTPFSFVDYFLHTFNGGGSPKESVFHRSVELILCTVRGIGLLEFLPSEVAAAVALATLSEAQSVEAMEYALNVCPYVKKEKVITCYEAMQDMRRANEISHLISAAPQSPIGVLDANWLSDRSDQTMACSQANLQNSPQSAKRRKLSG